MSVENGKPVSPPTCLPPRPADVDEAFTFSCSFNVFPEPIANGFDDATIEHTKQIDKAR